MRSQGQRAIPCSRTRGSGGVPTLALAVLAALPLAPAGLRAEPAEERPATERRRTLTATRHLGPHLDTLRDPAAAADPARPPDWTLHIQKGTGLEYRRRLRMGERPIELGVQGPVVRKKKSLGLTLVVRF